MTAARLLRPPSELHADPAAGRFLGAYLVSLLFHALLLIGFAGGWLGSPAPRGEAPPVYTVDLVHKPVLNPQAGRPEPREVPPASAVPPDALTMPGKNASADRQKPLPADKRVKTALEALRDDVALRDRLAAMRQAQAISKEIRVGMPNASGREEGVDAGAYIQTTLQSNWALSPYLLGDPARMAKIEAWVVLTYSKSGRLEGFRFEQESGDPQFDETIRRALVKSQQLPQPLPARVEEVRVIFNLKEMNVARGAR